MTAHQQIIDGMQACLPKGCSLPFTIVSAKFIKKHVARARVKLFDGLLGTLEVSRVPYGGLCSGWCIHWQDLPGGAINWNGSQWERVCDVR